MNKCKFFKMNDESDNLNNNLYNERNKDLKLRLRKSEIEVSKLRENLKNCSATMITNILLNFRAKLSCLIELLGEQILSLVNIYCRENWHFSS